MAYNFYIEFKRNYRGYVKGVKYGVFDIDDEFYYVPKLGNYRETESVPKRLEGDLFKIGEIIRRL